MFQTFLEHNQPPDTSVAVPEGMDALKPHMKRKDIFKRHRLLAVILIRQLFIIADGKPIFFCAACSGFQNKMQVFDEFLAELRFCAFDNLVNTAETIDVFDDFKLSIKRSSQSANRDDLFCRFLFIQPLLIRPGKR